MRRKKEQPERIDTGGGAVILGSVNVQGDFIGRDQIMTRRKKEAT